MSKFCFAAFQVDDSQHTSVTASAQNGRTGGGLHVDDLVLAGVLPDGVWWGAAVHPPVPGDPEERDQRGLLHQGVPCAAHSQHPAHLFLVRTTSDVQTRQMSQICFQFLASSSRSQDCVFLCFQGLVVTVF